MEDLVHAVFHVHSEVLGNIVGEVGNANRLGDIFDGVAIPEGHEEY